MSETEDGGSRTEEPRRSALDVDAPPKEDKEPRGGGGSQLDPDAWMVTFSDLLTLLMTFFVLIFASQDPVPPQTLFEAFGQSSGVFGSFRMSFMERITALDRQSLNEDLVQVFLNEMGAPEVQVEQQARGLVVTLPAETYFAPGSVQLNPKAVGRLNSLTAYLAKSAHQIRVEGHTDTTEEAQAPYPGRWELALARAHRVLLYLEEHGMPQRRLSLTGYGPTRPVQSNRTRTGRSRNRRVEIVILNQPGEGA